MSKGKNRRAGEATKQPLSPNPVPQASAAATPPAAPEPARSARITDWFLSGTIRHATAMRKHVQKILNHQRDILSPQATEAVAGALAQLKQAVASNADTSRLEKQMENLESVANKWLRPY